MPKKKKVINKKETNSEAHHHPHSIWKGFISFGLVNIPVVLFSAENPSEEIHFKLLDKKNLANIKYLKVNAETGKEVPWGDIVKGYEYEPGNYAVLTEADLESVAIKNLKTIEIEDFIDVGALSSVYFEKPYYLLPDKGGDKGYVLLRETLKQAKKMGIAKVMIHTHQYLAAISVYGPALIVNTIRYPEEVKTPAQMHAPDQDVKSFKISKKEFEIAEQLVNTMSVKWDPKRYNNLYREDLIKLVEEKVKSKKKGSVKHVKGPVVKQTNVIDFMALLKKSVKEKQKPHSTPTGKEKTKGKSKGKK